MRGIMWFREDLRLTDNTALSQACAQCEDGIVGVFFIDMPMWQAHDMAACKIDFLLRAVKALDESLALLNIPLRIITVKKDESIAKLIGALAEEIKAEAVFMNRQYEVNEEKRDQEVVSLLLQNKIKTYLFHDQTILPPGSVLNQQGEFFKVFTAYKHAWFRAYQHQSSKPRPQPKAQKPIIIGLSEKPKLSYPSQIEVVWNANESTAHSILNTFMRDHIRAYDQERDFPALKGTSKLSPYLASGLISPRLCLAKALSENNYELDAGNKGICTWIQELIWRDFYKHILVAYPQVAKHRAFKSETEKLRWQENKTHLKAWQNGQTGFPLIDAAMRQLKQVGWMHNRLRMVTAMFFAKNLFLDWRLGEKYFMQHLIDGDLAANNGGWQWCASTGTDAVPYFRLFNPIKQSERFDPAGKFIKHYCPELAHLDKRVIHDPYARAPELKSKLKYPQPIINYKSTREHVIKAFKALKMDAHSTAKYAPS